MEQAIFKEDLQDTLQLARISLRQHFETAELFWTNGYTCTRFGVKVVAKPLRQLLSGPECGDTPYLRPEEEASWTRL